MNWGSKQLAIASLLLLAVSTRAEDSLDLPALAKKARPAVLLLIVYDAADKEIATGTGFLVSNDGKLITNRHVIEKGSKAIAKAENGGLFPVQGVLANDGLHDLVLLKLDGKDFPSLPLGSSEKMEVGQRVAVIGSPLGLEGTVSEGILSGVRELAGKDKWLQITAAVSPGSSGSPILNGKGEVVGVATLLVTGAQSLNFGIPVEIAKNLLKTGGQAKPLANYAKNAEDEIWWDADYKAFLAASINGDHIEALKRIKLVLARFPNSDWAFCCEARTFFGLNFFDDAIIAYQQAIKIKPDEATTWSCLGIAYSSRGKLAEAIHACQQAIKIKPDELSSWTSLAFVYEKAGRRQDAADANQKADEIAARLRSKQK